MEGDAENGRRRRRRKLMGEKKEQMPLEDYVDFFVSRKGLRFTINILNQIIQMHGFSRIYKSPKNIIADSINTMDLIDPWRSTLKQKITSSAATATPTLEDVIADLECLKWQECCVTSLQVLNAEKEAAQIAPALSDPKQNSNKRKEASIKKLLKGSKVDDSKAGEATKNQDVPEKTGSKKKKRKKSPVAAGSDDGRSGNLAAAAPFPSLEVSCVQSNP